MVNVGSNATAASAEAAAAWAALAPQVTVTGVTIASQPVVTFTVKDAAGNAVVGLGNKTKSATATVANLSNLGFTLAKMVPGTNGDPSKWVSYNVVRPVTVAEQAGTIGANSACNQTDKAVATWCGTFPTTDTQGTLVDNGDGSYKYTFYRDPTQVKTIVATLTDSTDGLTKKADLGDLTFDPTLTHRVGVIISGNAPGTGTNTPTGAASTTPAAPMVSPANAVLDFRPDGGAITATRNIVKIESCASCHDFKPLAHGGSRKNPEFCVTCHTDQVRYSFNKEAPMLADGITFAIQSGTNAVVRPAQAVVDGRAVGNFPNYIHKLHMGENLIKQGYNYNNDGGAMLFNENRYPQDVRNCTKCHDASNNATTGTTKTTDGDNWKKVPNMLACGSCHDGINFATGGGTTLNGQYSGHVGGAKADNAQCVLCHDATTIPVYHQTTVASPNNPVVKAGAASFVYKISGATISSNKLVVKFQILKDGAAVKLNTYAAGAVPITGYTGGPSFLVIYATGQDGIAAPSDWNSGHDTLSLTDAWAGANGNTLVLSDAATNTYTVTIAASTTGRSPSHSLALPADAKMVTAMMAGAFVDPTIADNAGALPGVPAMMAATGKTPDGTANVARRVIFSETKCNSCHDRLGTSPNFHGGSYSIAMCAACHTPNQGGSTGWSASFRVWVHGIHSAEKRTIPFTWHAVSATDTYMNVGYPGVLKDCAQCHLPGTYDFSASQYTDTLIGNMLNVQAATGAKVLASSYVPPQAAPVGSAATSGLLAYGLVSGQDYGTGWSINAATGQLVAKTSQDTNLVTSPITAVCSTCHDSASAISHFSTNNGSFYQPRSVALTKTETCLICHGPGKVAAIADVHK